MKVYEKKTKSVNYKLQLQYILLLITKEKLDNFQNNF